MIEKTNPIAMPDQNLLLPIPSTEIFGLRILYFIINQLCQEMDHNEIGYGLLRGLAPNLANISQVENHAVIFVSRHRPSNEL
jgi:hypothetical protein